MAFGFAKKALGGLVGGALDIFNAPFKSLMPGSPDMPPLPQVKKMPVGDEDEKRKARRRAIAAQLARSGRASTIMSQQSETLG